MAGTIRGQKRWWGARDAEGHREYHVLHHVECLATDGPAVIFQTPGLYVPGATWSLDSDSDPWAFCLPTATITPIQEGEPNTHFNVEQVFSSKPPPFNQQRCNDTTVEDPILEPAKVSGGGLKYLEEATQDRWGRPLVNSAWEQLRGPQVEFDKNRATVRIEQNVASAALAITLPAAALDAVNYAPLWGLGRRCVKLSGWSWEKLYYGNCYSYYKRMLEFDIDANTFDRIVLDEGTKVLNGKWAGDNWELVNIDGAAPDRMNPGHFILFQDRTGNPARVVLNGFGLPAGALLVTEYYYVSISNNNRGNELTDTNHWRRMNGSPKAWDAATAYVVGDMVYTTSGGEDSFRYLCITDNTNSEPPSANWYTFNLDTMPTGFNDKGVYEAERVEYNVGDFVRASGGRTGFGQLFVSKYLEYNFLTLGIPSSL